MILRKGGRRTEVSPLFAHQCIRLVAAEHLSKARGTDVPGTGTCRRVQIPLAWSVGKVQRRRILQLLIESTPQPYGGHRWWWVCPNCQQRRGVLFLPQPDGELACRTCWPIRYLAAYPRHRGWETVASFMDGRLASCAQNDPLLAPRRRGVRRGRHVLRRALHRLLRDDRDSTVIATSLKDLIEQRSKTPMTRKEIV